MPFCSKCGNPLQPSDKFCKICGTPQPGFAPGAATAVNDPPSSLDPHVASALCYIPFVGWIVSIYVLATARFRAERSTRFHAFQGLYIFVAWLIYSWVVEKVLYAILPRPWYLSQAIKTVFTLGWIWMVYQTSQKVMVRIPFLAELAEKSVDEQK